jgi:stearoyl-CoA desaturase (Delta-9 desaturase)
MGEGWHNNHHAFPTSARHGLWWWQLDVSYWVIRGLALVGLAWKVKVPAAQELQRSTSNA